jgi:hypothetical protein
MNASTTLFLVSSILPLLILTNYSSGTSAQTATPAPRASIVSSNSGVTSPAVLDTEPATTAPPGKFWGLTTSE